MVRVRVRARDRDRDRVRIRDRVRVRLRLRLRRRSHWPAAEVIARARLLAAHEVAVGAVLDLILPVMPPLSRLLFVRLRRLARRRRLLLRVRVSFTIRATARFGLG